VLDLLQPDLVVAELEKIVSSPPLESSPSLCRFLRYVVEETLAGRGNLLKEYSLGVAVFERGDNFDPRLDPIVRVQARNLRVRLAQYYAAAGAGDSMVIDLPKRTYVPVFTARKAETEEPGAPVASTSPLPAIVAGPVFAAETLLRRLPVIAAATLLLIGGSAALWHFQPVQRETHPSHTPDPAAQDLYIRGRYLMDRQTESAIRDSIDCFQRAVVRDPIFAAAHASMADAYNILSQYGYTPPAEGMEQARRAAQRALDIDPKLAEGHVALASVLEAYDWNWAGAEAEYRRALKLNPWLPAAHLWYGMFLRDQGRLQEALPELRRAAELDPFSVLTSINLAYAYRAIGNYDAAIEQARHTVELAPQLATGYMILWSTYRAQKKTPEADAALAAARQRIGNNPHAIALVARAYAFHGQREEGIGLLRQLEDMAKHRYISPFDLGTISLGLGDEKRALELLEEAYRQRSSGLIFLRDDAFKNMRNAAPFHSLIEKMHFAG
jgi:tetratricopeptide (TPR) repeat protein